VYARWRLVPPFPLVRDDLFYRVHLDVPVFVVGMVACQRDLRSAIVVSICCGASMSNDPGGDGFLSCTTI